MKYISLIHALNIPCELDTGGDWHIGSINWENLNLLESDGSIWGDYGIEQNKLIPMHEEYFNVANHIRALLDLLFIGNFSIAEGMNDNYIGNSKYDLEIFNQVIKMINLPNWNKIDKFMDKEYLGKWIEYKEHLNIKNNNKVYDKRYLKLNKNKDLQYVKKLYRKYNTFNVKKDSLNKAVIQKVVLYSARNKIKDLYNICFIINNYWDYLDEDVKSMIRDALEYKNFNNYRYINEGKNTYLINKDRLKDLFLKVYQKVGLKIYDESN